MYRRPPDFMSTGSISLQHDKILQNTHSNEDCSCKLIQLSNTCCKQVCSYCFYGLPQKESTEYYFTDCMYHLPMLKGWLLPGMGTRRQWPRSRRGRDVSLPRPRRLASPAETRPRRDVQISRRDRDETFVGLET